METKARSHQELGTNGDVEAYAAEQVLAQQDCFPDNLRRLLSFTQHPAMILRERGIFCCILQFIQITPTARDI